MLKITKFLLCVDKEENELYILHREFPSCLIYVEQTTPINFVVLDLYEDISEGEAAKLLMDESFKTELNAFFQKQAFNFKDLN